MLKRKYYLLAICLLAGLTMGLMLPSIVGSNGLVSVTSTRTVDGDPSDWTGTAGATNNWAISNGEGIWNDLAFDDTGNGSYVYPNGTHSSPLIPDSAGAPWAPGEALAYTDKFNATGEPVWYKHGGMVDLAEFRVTADDEALYMLIRIENMGSFDNAVEWNYWAHNMTVGWDANASGYGKVLIHVYIDTDQVYGSGSDECPDPWRGNYLISNESAWEHAVYIQGDNRRFGYANWPVDPKPAYYGGGLPLVNHSDGTYTLLNQSSGPGTPTIYTRGDADIYPAAIEMKVPYSALQGDDPRGQTWRFTVIVAGADEGYYRQVWNTTLAQSMGWPQLFRFAGGEGGDAPTMGNNPNIIDLAFTPNQTAQEAILNNFTKLPGSGLAVIKAYQDVAFDATGDVVSEKLIYSLLVVAPILLVIILYVRKPKLNRTVKRY